MSGSGDESARHDRAQGPTPNTQAHASSRREPFHVRVRSAGPRDGGQLAVLMAQVYAEGRWFVGDGAPTGEELARRLRSLDPMRELFLVAETAHGTGRQTVGWIEVRRYAPRRLEHVATLTIAVAAEARSRGIGRRLMRAVLPWARRVGVRRIQLNVRAGNDRAIALYRSEGYVVEGVEREQIREGEAFEDNVLMARPLA